VISSVPGIGAVPNPQPERLIEAFVLTSDGRPRPRAVVTVLDASEHFMTSEIADQNGRVTLHLFVDTPYHVHAVWPGDAPGMIVSAVPIVVPSGDNPLTLQLLLT
jgi:hypothetical protein